MNKKWFWILLWVVMAFGLQCYRLADELPANRLGPTGVFLLDEGFYQMSAAHRAQFGEWQMPGNMYGGWTTRGYQAWVWAFFEGLGVNLFLLLLDIRIVKILFHARFLTALFVSMNLSAEIERR